MVVKYESFLCLIQKMACARLPRSVWIQHIMKHLQNVGNDSHYYIYNIAKAMPWLISDMLKDNVIRIIHTHDIKHCTVSFQINGTRINDIETIIRMVKRNGVPPKHIYHQRLYDNDGFTHAHRAKLHNCKQNYCIVYHHWRESELTVHVCMFDVQNMLTIVNKIMKKNVDVISGPNAVMNGIVMDSALYIAKTSSNQRQTFQPFRMCSFLDDDIDNTIVMNGDIPWILKPSEKHVLFV